MRIISIRTRFLLVILMTLFLVGIIALVSVHVSNKLRVEHQVIATHSAFLSDLGSLQRCVQELLENKDPSGTANCIREVHQLEEGLLTISAHESLKSDSEVQLKAEQVRWSLSRLVSRLETMSDEDNLAPVRIGSELAILGELADQLEQAAISAGESLVSRNRNYMIAALFLGIFLIGTVLILLSTSISRSLGTLVDQTRELQEGRIPLPLEITPGDELGLIAQHLNAHVDDLRTKIQYVMKLSGEDATEIYKPGEFDELGNALVILSGFLSKKELEDISRVREDKKQNWISEGIAQVGEVLRSERENVGELAFSIIQKLISYMKVEMGSLYITSWSEEEDADGSIPVLELAASFAYDRRKYQKVSLQWGEGLPGTCAQEKKQIFLTDVPPDYFEVSSGTGSARPNCILLVPMMVEEEVHGVIELATVRLLRPFEIDFVESLADSIASSLMAVQTNERTSRLLEQSQVQIKELENREAAASENLQKLEEARSTNEQKGFETNGIVDAMNQSILVAELGLNGRYNAINDRFLDLLGLQKEQVLGKPHGEIVQVDPYSEQYKEFWANLRKGERVSNVESYRQVSGEEVMLMQNYTPLVNNEGKVYKILNIATDITENLQLRERLKSKETEITLGTLEMETLNNAVNSALIKCELDADGIIVDVNGNYTEVTGYSRKEMLGRNYRLFLKDTEKDQFEKIWHEVTKQKVYEGVIRRSKPTGEEVWLVSTFSPVVDESGIIRKVYFMGLDITEKKLKYQLLEEANREIDRLKEQIKEYEN